METTREEALLAERGLEWLAGKARKYRVCVLTCLATGALAYMFAFTNKLINHDDVNCLFSKGSTITWGRWGLELMDVLFPNCSMPWIYGVLTMLLITAAVCMTASIFAIENKLFQGLLGGCMMVFPSIIGTFGYMFTSSSYGVAILLAVVSVWLVTRHQRCAFAGGVACLVFSVSIYQSYVSIAASFLVLSLVRQLLEGEECGPVIRRGFVYLGFLAVSLGLYYAVTQVVFLLVDTNFGSYATETLSFTPAHLIEGLKSACYNFFGIFFMGFFGLIPTRTSQIAHLLCLLCAGALMPYGWLKEGRRGLGRFALLLGLLALLPLAINCMYLFSSDSAIHTLVLYGFVAIYVLALLFGRSGLPNILPKLGRLIARNGIALALAVILVQNVYIANEAYLGLFLKYENTYAFYTSLIADIKMTPGFTEGTRLALVGQWQSRPFYRGELSEAMSIAGMNGFHPDDYSKQAYLEYYIGFPMEFVSDEEVEAIQNSPEFAAMPVYPYYGSLAMIGDVLVVKLS